MFVQVSSLQRVVETLISGSHELQRKKIKSNRHKVWLLDQKQISTTSFLYLTLSDLAVR